MNEKYCCNYEKNFELHTLPDIEIYGGDTTPWVVTTVNDDGCSVPSNCEAILTIAPFKASSGVGNYASTFNPILTIDGMRNTEETFVFDFTEEDTINLRGKFVYQIEMHYNGDSKYCQGILYIKENINR